MKPVRVHFRRLADLAKQLAFIVDVAVDAERKVAHEVARVERYRREQ